VGSLKKNTTLEYSTRVVQEGDRRCEKSTLNDLAYLTPLRIPLMNPVLFCTLSIAVQFFITGKTVGEQSGKSNRLVFPIDKSFLSVLLLYPTSKRSILQIWGEPWGFFPPPPHPDSTIFGKRIFIFFIDQGYICKSVGCWGQ